MGSVHWAALARSTARALGLPKDPSVALAHLCLGFLSREGPAHLRRFWYIGFPSPISRFGASGAFDHFFHSFFRVARALCNMHWHPFLTLALSARAPCVLHLHTFSFWRFKRVPLFDSTLAG